ncbi:MAG: uncharacterized protein QOD72_2717 [Acidimicrobiaceae bacterium]|jgi:uncharacterized OB-fold protein|nr:uncharacterized protein [Acidimicrobiaceae bacterium]
MQYCNACDRYQFPSAAVCSGCESVANVEWREVSGRGTIYSYGVVYDTPIAALQPDMPFNVAVIDLTECPGVNVLSHLPGTPADEVSIGAAVDVIFITTAATGQKVPEWQLLD